MNKFLHVALLALCAVATAAAETKRPNIILFLADDMGFGDLNCYGNPDVSTPNIDRLASEGLKFTDAHSPAAVCQPTRYAILSGRYYGRSAYGRIQSGIYFRKNEILFPQLLQKAGYNTAAFGKWHLGFGLTERGQPTDRALALTNGFSSHPATTSLSRGAANQAISLQHRVDLAAGPRQPRDIPQPWALARAQPNIPVRQLAVQELQQLARTPLAVTGADQ